MKLKRRYWRDVIMFALGTFFGGFVVNLLSGLVNAIFNRGR